MVATDKINVPQSKKKRRDWAAIGFMISMMFLPILHLIVFWLFVNVDSLALSFQKYDMASGKWLPAGFGNYRELFASFVNPTSVLPRALLNSFTLFLWNDFVLIPISLFFSYILYKKLPMGNMFKVIFFLPSVISVVVLTLVYSYMFNNFIPEVLKSIGLEDSIPWLGYFGDPKYAWWMVLFYGLWTGIGSNIVLMSGSMARIPTEVLEAGKLDGLSMMKELWYVVIPLIGSTISTLMLMGTSVIFTYFLQPKLLLGDSAESVGGFTIALFIVNNVRDNGTAQMAMGATIGILCALIGTPIVVGSRKLLDKFFPVYEY